MATLNARPDSVDILAYAGDTLTIKIVAPNGLVQGMVWHAGIKSRRSSTTNDATFVVMPPTVAGGPAFLTLTSDDSLKLMGIAQAMAAQAAGPSQQSVINEYVGHWDCQISSATDDPVRTLVQGKITIALDVTRP